tara:strand:- start:1400 stop:1579 length:180 start_codon:yes stop_codon:yes gene_type:complete
MELLIANGLGARHQSFLKSLSNFMEQWIMNNMDDAAQVPEIESLKWLNAQSLQVEVWKN